MLVKNPILQYFGCKHSQNEGPAHLESNISDIGLMSDNYFVFGCHGMSTRHNGGVLLTGQATSHSFLVSVAIKSSVMFGVTLFTQYHKI